MQVRLAKHSGFCFGVKRAIRLAEETAAKYGHAITIGPIIHNPQMVEILRKAGVKAEENLDLIEKGPVIIRSHGIPGDDLKKIKRQKLEVIDATCPFVAKAHLFARLASKENYEIFILGNPDHPEIIALTSYIKKKVQIWEKGQPLLHGKYQKVAIICQTTQNKDNLKILTELLLPVCSELRIFNTICDATHERQESSLQLAKKSKIMIVIGGKNSSNTKMLQKLCSQFSLTKHIETANEIQKTWFKNIKNQNGYIGLTAGASTPDHIIIEIYNKIKEIVGELDERVTSVNAIPHYQEEPNEF